MTVKRPRIAGDLADKIDAARGLVPFEAFVRDALEQHLNERADWKLALEWLIINVSRHDILDELFLEAYGFDWKDFKAAVDRIHAGWEAEMDEQAVEDEHDPEA